VPPVALVQATPATESLCEQPGHMPLTFYSVALSIYIDCAQLLVVEPFCYA
jgi:hypothetical protein